MQFCFSSKHILIILHIKQDGCTFARTKFAHCKNTFKYSNYIQTSIKSLTRRLHWAVIDSQ